MSSEENDKKSDGLAGLRWLIDFKMIPNLFVQAPDGILAAFEVGEAEKFLQTVFNDLYDGKRVFALDDFKVTKYEDDNAFVYYVNLPSEHEGSIVWCEAYGFAFFLDTQNKSITCQFLTVELTEPTIFIGGTPFGGTRMLCGVAHNLEHLNFGNAFPTDKENAEKMLEIVKPKTQHVQL